MDSIQERLAALRTMPYEKYLQTPEWREKRDQALERDEHRCRTCNSSEKLQVHHRTYIRRGNEDLNDLTTLCQPCHEHFHERIRQIELMDQTCVPSIEDEVKIQRWEEYLLGLLLHRLDIYPHVCGILAENDFVGTDTLSLYQVLGSIYQHDPSTQVQYSDLPSDLAHITSRVAEMVQAHGLPDGSEAIKRAIWVISRIKREHLLRSSKELSLLAEKAAKSGDKNAEKEVWRKMYEYQQQIRIIESANPNLQG